MDAQLHVLRLGCCLEYALIFIMIKIATWSLYACCNKGYSTSSHVGTGVRSMLYGSMLGLLGAAVLGSLAARYFGVSSLQDLKPASDSHDGVLRKWLQPYKERLQVRLSMLYVLSLW